MLQFKAAAAMAATAVVEQQQHLWDFGMRNGVLGFEQLPMGMRLGTHYSDFVRCSKLCCDDSAPSSGPTRVRYQLHTGMQVMGFSALFCLSLS